VGRRTRPTRVTCELFRSASAQAATDRNLMARNARFLYPYAISRDKIGPRESTLIAIEATKMIGASRTRAPVAATMSKTRLMRPPDSNAGAISPRTLGRFCLPLESLSWNGHNANSLFFDSQLLADLQGTYETPIFRRLRFLKSTFTSPAVLDVTHGTNLHFVAI